ncbi:MAG: TetR/AcrR family transcriptional regulator [Vulcanimicrobiota bacterium]
MARITKKYEERKKEILQTAEFFFNTRGYQKTTIQNIINKLGIAKGTFYHYFKSKEDLLDQLTENLSSQGCQIIKSIINKAGLSAVEKMRAITKELGAFKAERIQIMADLTKVIYSEKNIAMAQKMKEKNYRKMVPLFTKIIEQGNREGLFSTPYPEEAAYFFLVIGEAVRDQLLKSINKEDTADSFYRKIEKKLKAGEYAISKILGVDETLEIFNLELAGKLASAITVSRQKQKQ